MSSENSVLAGSLLTASTWRHLSNTYDAGSRTLYVNGAQMSGRAQAGSIKISAGPRAIGGDCVGGGYFQGLIDEVCVYNRALPASEVRTDIALGVAG